MERAFKLEGGQRHHDDATSVAAWVEEMRGKGHQLLRECIAMQAAVYSKLRVLLEETDKAKFTSQQVVSLFQ